ncbi:signaling threshold-regulating transmembrane adapter 1 [Mesocricetus auratus]|uniref:Signaling threshold-regulating transmembrane adapter 1 n=1 Tax=Mesocricetus auratus TaxID=10036 RepID=A0A3Q0D0F8_MESAU|nr:signaling threshold-regulating transmembrane adapter 1 [Mesocricetus auratus]
MDPTLTPATVMSRAVNCTDHLLAPGIPSITFAWGLWVLLGLVTVMLLILLTAFLSQWTSRKSRSPEGQGRSGGSVEEIPLYGNLHYLQTGRLSQEPRPEQQDPSPGGPARVSQLAEEKGREGSGDRSRGSRERPTASHLQATEEGMCYTSLQLRPAQGRIPSSGTPIKYCEVVLDSEPKPQTPDPEPELYASVCAQTRRARASFPDEAYANSQPASS